VNRAEEFVRVKEGNLGAVLEAIDDQRIECFYKSRVAGVERAAPGAQRLFVLVLATGQGEARVALQSHHRAHRRGAAARIRGVLRICFPGPTPRPCRS
jgi:hypothetical protein